MIVTNSEALDDKLRALKAHGARVKYYHDLVGYNSRLDTLQAAILLANFHIWISGRRQGGRMLSTTIVALPVTALKCRLSALMPTTSTTSTQSKLMTATG